MISLAALKPQITDIKITGVYGESITIPVMPLSFIQWNNAAIGVPVPKAPTRNLIETKADGTPTRKEVVDTNNVEYQQAMAEYRNTLALRRIAVALAGAGFGELQGKTLDEQVEECRDMDAGIVMALYTALEGMATRKRGNYFRAESVSVARDEDMQADGLDAINGLDEAAAD